MKKIIIVSALLCSLLFAPVFASAQTSLTKDALTQQLIQLLTQMIAQLQKQIADILAQQQVQTTTIQQQTQTIQQIQQNTQQIAQNTCVPNWQCNSWDVCSNSTQTRTCTDSNNCNTVNGKPTLVQSCTPPPQATIKVYETVDNADGSNGSFPINQDVTIKNRIQRVSFAVKTFDAQGKQVNNPIMVTTDDPDLPSTFTIRANTGFYVGDHHQSHIIQDYTNPTTGKIDGTLSSQATSCMSPDENGNDGCVPISTGTFTFTFTQPDLNLSQTIKLTVQ